MTRMLLLALAASAALLAGAGPAEAIMWRKGDFRLNFDSFFTAGWSIRTSGRDCRQIAAVNGGCNELADPVDNANLQGRLLNQDDGNLNWNKGDVFSVAFKGTHEIDARWRNFGAFVRFSYFGDAVQQDMKAGDRTDLAHRARFRDSVLEGGVVGAQFLLLDAYLQASTTVLERNFDFRVGNQVLSWGESVFAQGGINDINALDVSKIRLPGSELKDALLPSPIVRISGDIYKSLSFEAYYQFGWRRFMIDPVGTFFSTNDQVSRGAQGFFFPPPPASPFGCGDPGTASVDRPMGCPSDAQDLVRFARGIPFLGSAEAPDQGQAGVALRYYNYDWETELGLYYIHLHDKFPNVSFSGSAASLTPVQPNGPCAALPFVPGPGCDLGYFLQYGKDVDLFGLSFSTVLAGVAVGGEVSYRPNEPTPVGRNNSAQFPSLGELAANVVAGGGGGVSEGLVHEGRLVAILNGTWNMGPATRFVGRAIDFLGLTDVSFVAEGRVTHYTDLHPCNPNPGGLQTTPAGCKVYGAPLQVAKVDDTGFGYTLLLRPSYARLFDSPWGLVGQITFSQDVIGITPSGAAGVIEDVMALGLQLEASYQARYRIIVSYSNSFNAGRRNGNNDRDFASMSFGLAF